MTTYRRLTLAAGLFLLTVAAYWNSFHNSFHFDDSHTIVNNAFIRSLSNIPLFFRDGTTFSALPSNQSYRPIVSATLAFDYWLGKGLGDTFYFHLSAFLIFLVQGALMYALYTRIFDTAKAGGDTRLVAMLAVGAYLVHPANAETINYVIARSDSYSAMLIVLALLLYVSSETCRKWYLYLIPVALGMLTKPVTAVFPILLLAYLYLFGESAPAEDATPGETLAGLRRALIASAPAFVVSIALFLFVRRMDPPTWVAGGPSTFGYLITQPYVVLKYVASFFLPISLSADTDLSAFTSIGDIRAIVGLAFLVGLIAIAARTWRPLRLRPICYGILWFLVTLLPTSLVPLAEVMNDHRVFLPYIGLMLSVAWALYLAFAWLRERVASPRTLDTAVAIALAVVLMAAAYGTHRRNEVWRTEETLWRDVTLKSPKNGRGLMNYGLVLMAKADYAGAESYFLKALELTPNYGILHTNLGILYAAKGDTGQAEQYLKRAVALQPSAPDPYFYYARFLQEQGRNAEARKNLETTLQLSPAHLDAHRLLMKVFLQLDDSAGASRMAAETLATAPTDGQAIVVRDALARGESTAQVAVSLDRPRDTPEYYLAVSLVYFRQGKFGECVSAANEALRLRPGYALAYNNICCAYTELKQWDEAIAAGRKAVQFAPESALARNNLARARAHGKTASVSP